MSLTLVCPEGEITSSRWMSQVKLSVEGRKDDKEGREDQKGRRTERKEGRTDKREGRKDWKKGRKDQKEGRKERREGGMKARKEGGRKDQQPFAPAMMQPSCRIRSSSHSGISMAQSP